MTLLAIYYQYSLSDFPSSFDESENPKKFARGHRLLRSVSKANP